MKTISVPILTALILMFSSMGIAAPSAVVGQPAPDFVLRSTDGSNLRLSEYRSEVVVLSFWAPWCGKCRDAMGYLNDLQQEHKSGGFAVLAVGVDGHSDKTQSFLADMAVSYPVIVDDDMRAVSREYEVGTLPLTLVIDREGNIRYIHKGFKNGSSLQIADEVAELLAE